MFNRHHNNCDPLSGVFGARGGTLWAQLCAAQARGDDHFCLLHLCAGIPVVVHTTALLLSEPWEGGVLSLHLQLEATTRSQSYLSPGDGSGTDGVTVELNRNDLFEMRCWRWIYVICKVTADIFHRKWWRKAYITFQDLESDGYGWVYLMFKFFLTWGQDQI